METLGQQLQKLQIAIDKVLENQEWTLDGKTYKKADLEALRRMKSDLESQIQVHGFDYRFDLNNSQFESTAYIKFH